MLAHCDRHPETPLSISKKDDIHEANTENTQNLNLVLRVHLQSPYDRDWYRPHRDVRNDIQSIKGHSELESIDTRASLDCYFVVLGKWMATEQKGEGFRYVVGRDDRAQRIHGNFISFNRGHYSQDKENDGKSDGKTGYRVDNLDGKFPLVFPLAFGL